MRCSVYDAISSGVPKRPAGGLRDNDHIIDALRCAMLIRGEGNLDPVGEEVVSLKPVLTNPVFI